MCSEERYRAGLRRICRFIRNPHKSFLSGAKSRIVERRCDSGSRSLSIAVLYGDVADSASGSHVIPSSWKSVRCPLVLVCVSGHWDTCTRYPSHAGDALANPAFVRTTKQISHLAHVTEWTDHRRFCHLRFCSPRTGPDFPILATLLFTRWLLWAKDRQRQYKR